MSQTVESIVTLDAEIETVESTATLVAVVEPVETTAYYIIYKQSQKYFQRIDTYFPVITYLREFP